MKKYAVTLKNFSAVLMLIALLTFMLPVCEVTVLEHGTTKISGFDMVAITAEAAREYVHNGIIADDYVLAKGITFGMVADGIAPLTEGNQLGHLILITMILILPGSCCFFAMITTIKADEIKKITLPMILIGISILEIAGLIALLFQSCFMVKRCVTLQPSVGIYASTVLCILALVILMVLRMTEGFHDLNQRNH